MPHRPREFLPAARLGYRQRKYRPKGEMNTFEFGSRGL